jgi:hypothetical protein
MSLPEDFHEIFSNYCASGRPIVWVSTIDDGTPHLVPVCFVKVLGEDKILIANVFIKKTVRNIEKGSKIAVGAVVKEDGFKGYMIKGRAENLKEGKLFEDFAKEVSDKSGGRRKPKSAVLVTIEEVYSLKPYEGRKRII